MGYDLHITRKDLWAMEEDERLISRLEWKAYVENDPEIIPDADNPYEDNYVYLRTEGNWPLWFNPELGNIYTKNPPDDVIKKIVKIAVDLKARVQGDDQEFYDFSGQIYREPMECLPETGSKSTGSYERYIWYFCAIIFVTSIVWHIFISGK